MPYWRWTLTARCIVCCFLTRQRRPHRSVPLLRTIRLIYQKIPRTTTTSQRTRISCASAHEMVLMRWSVALRARVLRGSSPKKQKNKRKKSSSSSQRKKQKRSSSSKKRDRKKQVRMLHRYIRGRLTLSAHCIVHTAHCPYAVGFKFTPQLLARRINSDLVARAASMVLFLSFPPASVTPI